MTIFEGRAPAALLFDMDGLLLDSERIARRAFLVIMDEMGKPRAETEPMFLDLIGGSEAHTRAVMEAYLNLAEQKMLDQRWHQEFSALASEGIPLRPTVAEVLPQLQEAGHRMAVVTSTHRHRALHHLETAGLLDLFERVIGGDEVRAPKPDPAPYLQAADWLGVAAGHCAAFEDSDKGTTAAVAAGCITTQIPDLRPDLPLPPLGQRIAPDLRSALEALSLV